MTALRGVWARLLAAAVIAGVFVAGVGGGLFTQPVDTKPAADVSNFDAGNLISDAVFFDSGTMDVASVQSFLNTKGQSCRAGSDGTPCIKDYRQDTTSRSADSYCSGYAAAPQESAAQIIVKTAISCRINPRVLLVMLQKEQALVTNTGATLYASRYQKAMGFACPDTAACDAAYYGFQNQVYSAARQFQRYAANPSSFGYRQGFSNRVLYSPNTACGSSQVVIANQATAGLYNYTPYQPNAAALAAGYGSGDSCSAYGNRNFWLYFTDWFGSTQSIDGAADLPVGSFDEVSSAEGRVTVRGWALDPNQIANAVTVHVYVNGEARVAAVANANRPDVAAAYPGAGSGHGFQVSLTLPLGDQQVCIYAINLGAGSSNPQLGCRSIRNIDLNAPAGALDAVTTVPGRVTLRGWAFDVDAPSAVLDVAVYLDGAPWKTVSAGSDRPDVGAALGAAAGSAHGIDTQLDVTAGRHTFCAYAVNVGRGTTNTTLGCSTVVVEDPASYNPVGVLDAVVATGGTVNLRGWTYDPDSPGDATAVRVYVDGTYAASLTADEERPDVAAARPGVGALHGFSWTAVLPAGSRQVCVYALNSGYGTTNPTLGCRTVATVAGAAAEPRGSLDDVVSGTSGVVVRGWSFDPDVPTAPVAVHVYVDGRAVSAISAAEPRGDVARAYPGVGEMHGYSWSGELTVGQHTVCTYAINVGAGTANPLLGCRSVTVVAGGRSPIGSFDDASVGVDGVVNINGWTFDPDRPAQALAVHVYVDGVGASVLSASAPRGDVAQAYPDAGANHGWSWTGAVSPGRHQVCAYAINIGPNADNTLLGCRTVTR